MTQDRVASALEEWMGAWTRAERDDLLNTVRALIAAELRAAADGIGDWPGVGNLIRRQLRDRASDWDDR